MISKSTKLLTIGALALVSAYDGSALSSAGPGAESRYVASAPRCAGLSLQMSSTDAAPPEEALKGRADSPALTADAPAKSSVNGLPIPPVVVTVDANGSFSPSTIHVRGGDTVEWQFTNADDAVVASTWSDLTHQPLGCLPPKPWGTTLSFAGPLPVGASGAWTIGPFSDEKGFEVADASTGCSDGSQAVVTLPAPSTQILCATGELGATMSEETWESNDIRGVHIRLLWKDLQPDITYRKTKIDPTILKSEIQKAVANGKLFSLSIKAGKSGTPDWIFSTDVDAVTHTFVPRADPGPVERHFFVDRGDDLDASNCGYTMFLGNPTDKAYHNLWGNLLEQVATFVKSRADWYRALAYFKISGANLLSEENRLPNHCTPGCPCNTEVWARAGYTQTKLHDFYNWQRRRIGELFPGKPITYQLIQAGFPRVNDDGCWWIEASDPADPDATGCPGAGGTTIVTPGVVTLPAGTAQTEQIIRAGENDMDYGRLFVVQHNGIGPAPAAGYCPTYQQHPAAGTAASKYPHDEGCPNHWVLTAGARTPAQLTGFQTNNAKEGGVRDPADVDRAFQNVWDNSDGAFLEIYEQRHWEANRYEQNGVVQCSGHTISAWGNLLDGRRSIDLVSRTGLADPNTRVYRHFFPPLVPGSPAQTIYYYNPTRCAFGAPRTGKIILRP